MVCTSFMHISCLPSYLSRPLLSSLSSPRTVGSLSTCPGRWVVFVDTAVTAAAATVKVRVVDKAVTAAAATVKVRVVDTARGWR